MWDILKSFVDWMANGLLDLLIAALNLLPEKPASSWGWFYDFGARVNVIFPLKIAFEALAGYWVFRMAWTGFLWVVKLVRG